MQANAARLAYRYCRHQLRSPSAREEGDFSLPEALNGALLAPKLTESGECRLNEAADYYRKNLWKDMDCYLEIWVEKDALAGIIYDITRKYDVSLNVARGYS